MDCCYSNQLDLLRVETRVCTYNFYTTPFLSFPSHLTSVKFMKLKEPKVCKREKEREKEKKQRENKVFFFEENELPPKNKNKK
jgi:hypothetical protein